MPDARRKGRSAAFTKTVTVSVRPVVSKTLRRRAVDTDTPIYALVDAALSRYLGVKEAHLDPEPASA